ncbi:MAG: hypothetical protein DWQ04_29055 [Chloroflexi bacterium]|nr:MAG: hypothetical protein DWQ04_29055 [Chloroflexota bacterium]
MKSFIVILILLWIVISAIVILFVVVLSSRLGRQELDITYQENFEEEESDTFDLNESCAIL